MYTREDYLKSVQKEIRIIKHLATKIPAGMGDYRPSPAQRSTVDLLQYLSASGSGTIKVLLTEDMKSSGDYNDFKASVTVENFAEKMDAQERDIMEMLAKFSDEDFKKDFDFYGMNTKSGHLLEIVLKGFAAYRMQLFLYVKACGAYVSTMDVWAGMDTPPKKD